MGIVSIKLHDYVFEFSRKGVDRFLDKYGSQFSLQYPVGLFEKQSMSESFGHAWLSTMPNLYRLHPEKLCIIV